VTWKRRVNEALARTTGLELRRASGAPASKPAARRTPLGRLRSGDRLVQAPVFIMCTLRSGSTLLRVLLDSHSQLHAPHELHLRYVSVHLDERWSERSMKEMGLDAKALEYLLWDRILHRELAGSGKRQIVDKTPNNIFIADRLKECWPDARFVFLLRHPAAIARSRMAVKGEGFDVDKNLALIKRYCETLEAVRQAYPGHTLRYEDLTADPAAETRRLCDHLGVPWERAMLEYGRFDHGRLKPGLGDWADKIKTGTVQQPEAPPEEIPAALRDAAVAWGYAPAGTLAPSAP
jgi:hypothetical protein